MSEVEKLRVAKSCFEVAKESILAGYKSRYTVEDCNKMIEEVDSRMSWLDPNREIGYLDKRVKINLMPTDLLPICKSCLKRKPPTLCCWATEKKLFYTCAKDEVASETCTEFITDDEGGRYCYECLDCLDCIEQNKKAKFVPYGENAIFCSEKCRSEYEVWKEKHSTCNCNVEVVI